MIKIMARITSRPDTADQLSEVLHALVAPTRREPGCIAYELFQNQDNPVEFVTVESWADQAAADAHLGTPHIAEAFAKAGVLLAGAPLIHRFIQVS